MRVIVSRDGAKSGISSNIPEGQAADQVAKRLICALAKIDDCTLVERRDLIDNEYYVRADIGNGHIVGNFVVKTEV